MFCPLAVDYGNVADWVSGIASVIAGVGSVVAVIFAVRIANSQRRYDQQLRQIADNQAHEKRAHLIGEVIRLTAEIEAKIQEVYGRVVATSTFGDSWRKDISEIEPIRLQLESLQQLATSDPQLYGEIGRITREAVFVHDIHNKSAGLVGGQLRRMRDIMFERRAAVVKLLEN